MIYMTKKVDLLAMFSICVSTGTEPGWSMDIKRMQSAT